MTSETALRALTQKAKPAVVLAAGLAVLFGMNQARTRLREEEAAAAAAQARLGPALDDALQEASEAGSLSELKARDLARFKAGLSKLTQSRRTIYEAGLQLQEDKRLLEKQWEIMTTYLMVDPEARKIHLMRGEQSLESYPIAYAPAQAFGGETKPPPGLVQITSKERFAHPERGKYEEVDGQLQWEPPQVGTSARSNSLGEFVMFTRSSLILHGPPKKVEDHKAFAHYCLGLSAAVAHRLYAHSFIGTKIIIKTPKPLEGSAAAP